MTDPRVIVRQPGPSILSPQTRGWRYRGPWDVATPYAVNDIVTRNGSSYLCVTGHTGQQPPTQVWGLLAQGGSGGGGGASAMGDLTDVDLTGLADGDVITWDETAQRFRPVAPTVVTAGSIGAATTAELADAVDALEDADAALAGRLDTAEAAIAGEPALRDAAIADAVDAEAALRAAGDNAVANALTPLIAARALAADLAAEVAARQAGDTTLSSQITTGLAGKASTGALATETSERQAADTALDGRLTAVETDKADKTDSRFTDPRTPTAHSHPAAEISDSSAVGRAVLTAVDAAAARTAIGAASAGAALPTATTDGEYVRYNGSSYAASLLLAADISAALSATGALTIENATGQATMRLSANAGLSSRIVVSSNVAASRGVLYRTGTGLLNTEDRFYFYVSATSESGANAGSDWLLSRYSDAGVLLGVVLEVRRSNGLMTYNGAGITLQTGDLILTAGRLTFSSVTAAIRMGSTALTLENSGGSSRVWFGSLGNARLEQAAGRWAHGETFWSQAISSAFNVNYDYGHRHVLALTGSGTPATMTISNPSISGEVSNYAFTIEHIVINNSSVTFPAANFSFGSQWRLPVAGLPDIAPGQALLLRGARRAGSGSPIYVSAELTAA